KADKSRMKTSSRGSVLELAPPKSVSYCALHSCAWRRHFMISIRLRNSVLFALALVFLHPHHASAAAAEPTYYEVTRGSHPHDVAAAPTPGGPVYYTAQRTGKLGILQPASGKVEEIALGSGSAPHGVVIGPDGAPWITDGGQNAIVRVDPK